MSLFMHRHQKLFVTLLIIIFILSLIPIFVVAGFDAAAGDDYNYGAASHLSFLATGSVFAAVKAALKTTVSTWYSWQGTWFDCFVFCLHPEVFSDSAYVIVPYIFVLLQTLCYLIFAHHFVKKRFGIEKLCWIELAMIYLIFCFQLVPSQKSAFFWWVGSVHYAMPMCMTLIGIVLADRFLIDHKLKDIISLSVLAALVGGATYPAALLLILSAFLLWLSDFVIGKKRSKKNILLIIPFLLEIIGLFISMIAPGNAVRSASDIADGAAPSGGIIETIIGSITFSVKDALSLFLGQKTFVLIAFILIAIVSKHELVCIKKADEESFKSLFSHPLLFVTVMFLLNASVYAPRLYAGGNVSSGYYNFNFWVFFLCATGSIVYVSGWAVSVRQSSGSKHNFSKKADGLKAVLTFAAILAIAFLGRHGIKEYTDYICLEYYLSGHAADYKEQIALQRYLMEEEGIEDVVLPEINDYQGPLMHMPVVADPDNVDNYMTQSFYGKRSCRSIPREQWMAEYADKYQAFLAYYYTNEK